MLEITKLDAFCGETHALWGVSLRVDEEKTGPLVGANEAEKTTLLNAISGLHRSSSGCVEFLGKRIDGIAPHLIVEMGLV
jgi:ABC-type branched-subunit amino acid transport system ATPase component